LKPDRDFELRDLEAVFGVFRLVDLVLPRALPDGFRLVEVFFRAADVDFFRPAPVASCPALFLELLDAAPIRAPDTAPVRAPASARLRAPPVSLSARSAVSTTASRAALVDPVFLFAISYSHADRSPLIRR
jgi:hypothetical protein